tara:strand:+ start:105532 stop:105693 length:162 start_codon:yes stop_codon:yes gene_type:complete
MDNYHAELQAEMNRRMIEAFDMYSENLDRIQKGESIAYSDVDFSNLAHAPLKF